MAKAKPVVLLILDGWGYRAESEDNAIALAELPAWRRLLAECPNTLIHTEGRFVGLPDGVDDLFDPAVDPSLVGLGTTLLGPLLEQLAHRGQLVEDGPA